MQQDMGAPTTHKPPPRTSPLPTTGVQPIIPIPYNPSALFLINPILQATKYPPLPQGKEAAIAEAQSQATTVTAPGEDATRHPLFTCISRGLCKQKSPR